MVALISPALMNYLRAVQNAQMIEEATITTPGVEVPDGSGGTTTDDVTIGPIPCYRFPEVAGAGEVLIAGQISQGLRWQIGLPADTVVKDSSTIDIYGTVYEVVAVLAPESYSSVLIVYAIRR